MRNLNTSFVKNAIVRFGNEAVQVLRALANPATSFLRLLQSVVKTISGYWVQPSFGKRPISPIGTTGGRSSQPQFDRIMSKVFDERSGRHGGDRQDCLPGLTVS